jgi:hypothetical protein
MKLLGFPSALLAVLTLSGCSVFGKSSVETAPYKVTESAGTENAIEVRHYDSLVLVSAPMGKSMHDKQNDAFMMLFDYISGENATRDEISMTAPVFMDGGNSKPERGEKIPMTAPVFMSGESGAQDGKAMMSFVLPDSYTIESAPVPLNPSVTLHEITDYTAAVITFDGFLSQSNINRHKAMLMDWIDDSPYEQTGPWKAAGYDPPFTIPAFRRNEVLIPVQKRSQ